MQSRPDMLLMINGHMATGLRLGPNNTHGLQAILGPNPKQQLACLSTPRSLVVPSFLPNSLPLNLMPHKRNNDSETSYKTRWRPDKRGVKATKFLFTTEQEKILYEYGMDLEQNISDIAQNRALKNNPYVTAWKKKMGTEVLDRPEFETLDFSQHSKGEWFAVSSEFARTIHLHC